MQNATKLKKQLRKIPSDMKELREYVATLSAKHNKLSMAMRSIIVQLQQLIMVTDLLIKKGVITHEELKETISYIQKNNESLDSGEVQSEEEPGDDAVVEDSGQVVCGEGDSDSHGTSGGGEGIDPAGQDKG